jgi:hypothetical protein
MGGGCGQPGPPPQTRADGAGRSGIQVGGLASCSPSLPHRGRTRPAPRPGRCTARRGTGSTRERRRRTRGAGNRPDGRVSRGQLGNDESSGQRGDRPAGRRRGRLPCSLHLPEVHHWLLRESPRAGRSDDRPVNYVLRYIFVTRISDHPSQLSGLVKTDVAASSGYDSPKAKLFSRHQNVY